VRSARTGPGRTAHARDARWRRGRRGSRGRRGRGEREGTGGGNGGGGGGGTYDAEYGRDAGGGDGLVVVVSVQTQ